LKEEDLIPPEVEPISNEQFPDTLPMRNLNLPIQYRFDPGSDSDGLTLIIPQEGINQIDPQRLGWLVPGLLEEKITAVIKGLPKDLRRAFVPIPDTSREVLKRVKFGEGSFSAAVVRALESISGERIPREAIEAADVPSHLRMHIQVVTADGAPLATGPDLKTVQEKLGAEAAATFTTMADDRWQKDGLTKWDFGELPEEVPFTRSGLKLTGYPALSDQGLTVSLRLVDTKVRATHETQAGLRRLFVLALGRELKAQVDWLPQFSQMKLYSMTLPDAGVFRPQLIDLLAHRAFFATPCRPHNAEEFAAAVKTGKQRLGLAVQDLSHVLPPMLQHYQEIQLALEKMHGPAFQIVRADMTSQLEHLVTPGFLMNTPWQWLSQYPRYFRSMLMRRSKMAGPGLIRDQKLTSDISRAWRAYQDQATLHAERQIFDPELIQFRWMLEEYRVSVFTQELGTSLTVSPKRLDEQWAKVKKV
jgi:ATP-dependent helicase HrpA